MHLNSSKTKSDFFFHRSSERLMPLGIMGVQLRVPLKHLRTISAVLLQRVLYFIESRRAGSNHQILNNRIKGYNKQVRT